MASKKTSKKTAKKASKKTAKKGKFVINAITRLSNGDHVIHVEGSEACCSGFLTKGPGGFPPPTKMVDLPDFKRGLKTIR